MAEYTVRVHREPGDPGGEWGAEVLELPGCFATAATFDELREPLTEAIALYLDRPLP
jgi:predicted RNase H-like HicB family nuclease